MMLMESISNTESIQEILVSGKHANVRFAEEYMDFAYINEKSRFKLVMLRREAVLISKELLTIGSISLDRHQLESIENTSHKKYLSKLVDIGIEPVKKNEYIYNSNTRLFYSNNLEHLSIPIIIIEYLNINIYTNTSIYSSYDKFMQQKFKTGR